MSEKPVQPLSPFEPILPQVAGERLQWGGLHGSSAALAIANAASAYQGLLLVVTHDMQSATRLERELGFFLDTADVPVVNFPDWETLPYDLFSPLPELISQRLLTLYRLPRMQRGVLVAPVSTLMQRLAPKSFLDAHCLIVECGQSIDLDETRRRLEHGGYQCVSQVFSHGEFAVRGSLLDIFPMGSQRPYRIDLFDDEVDTIRTFDPESQRSCDKVPRIEMLPAREFPMDETGINRFRRNYRSQFEGDLQQSLIYQDVSDGRIPGGLEYYLPLFFEQTETLFDYLPEHHMVMELEEVRDRATIFFNEVKARFEERRHDLERPLLAPSKLYISADELASLLKQGHSIMLSHHKIAARSKGYADVVNFSSKLPPPVAFQVRSKDPASALRHFLENKSTRVLIIAEGAGRREMLLGTLRDLHIDPKVVDGWESFLNDNIKIALCVAPLEQGLWLQEQGIALITETQLYGERVRQERRRRKVSQDPDQIVRNLTELHMGAPVVHEDHGVGRYLGLQTLNVGGMETEFLTLEYARGDKLYVPVASLHLISRYAGASPENAPLHRLGGDQWEKTKRKAAKQIRDVAAELLEIYARRAARQGVAFPTPDDEYQAFASSFDFEETPDQFQTIDAVLQDMVSTRPMDRVVCGDVGFGKTEVAMRAAFMATQGNKQIAVLVPTTLLAQQHYQNFTDRFADWPVKVESLSRFRTGKQQQKVIDGLRDGTIDIVVGTHKLLSQEIKFKNLGLVIIDEEHRFGVRHKEKLKALRSEVDLLTLTATPIPRTLNMAMSGMRDLSIIATPPALRHPVKTFVSQWNDSLIIEACQRELKRGGQIYFLHNEVSTIENMAERLESLLPGIRLQIAHGQMRERELEGIMRDFYHQRFSLLVCTTIIESGIDVPSANTMIINRADKLGLAQLHQIRGRVGRSHHRAYAYLLTPPPGSMTADAKKRLEAIESLEDLGAGFTLSTHDLEIRGAGELLGEEQSGQIQEIGFSLYTELLDRAVAALKAGRQPELDRPLDHGTEIELNIPALLPEDYLPDVHSRLVLYKRIASAKDQTELRDLQVEMIDRFGLLPEATKNLFEITELKLRAHPLGIRKIEAGPKGARLLFDENPKLDPAILIGLIQSRPNTYKLDGNDKLRYFADLETPDGRVKKIHTLLDSLID
ncbi:MAG: transcription-repair coupling factor [Candidatus Thiodiazotropha taylori]|nr:transcription-repair coupling factor [Candidatus Thiodiazotropha taylori]MCW4224844.1 transcription-repair coupling factor [Candidatus Thiodiazotropha endolucinida]MCG7882388.1 transcription-repair coupling factor [Candidatus Thiodiazotropha taylori]MCG7886417.1 transcription-repair coupling factor [Candidatus Thiodiazotropha taylori]MCG7888949.1 transcription-repair coupling factor [Candidatus Thiodiazotropha taylori]